MNHRVIVQQLRHNIDNNIKTATNQQTV